VDMKKILAVSTDEQLVAWLQEELSAHGYNVQTIVDHEHLFSRIKEIDPNILIIDFMLEDDNAAALCHRLKSDPLSKDLAIVLISEFAHMQQFAARFGSFAMVQKPIDIGEILESIKDEPAN